MLEIRNLLYKCDQGADLIKGMERIMYEKGLVSASTSASVPEDPEPEGVIEKEIGDPGLLRLESSLLHLGALSYVCQGLFYLLPIKVAPNGILVRCETFLLENIRIGGQCTQFCGSSLQIYGDWLLQGFL